MMRVPADLSRNGEILKAVDIEHMVRAYICGCYP